MLQTGSNTGYGSKTVSFRKDTDTLSNYKKQWGEGIVREFVINMYTLLYLKWIGLPW